MKTSIKKPKFESEAEEADWYTANPDYILQQMTSAAMQGRLSHGTAAKRLGLKSTLPTTLRLNENDLDMARRQADKKGLRYQTYLKMLLHEALVRAES